MKIAVIHLPFSNLASITRYVQVKKLNYSIISQEADLSNFDKLILPGVGTFGNAIEFLKNNNLFFQIKEFASDKSKTTIGICLGMQILFESSDESIGCEGISVFKGSVSRMKKKSGFVLPHIGWNSVKKNKQFNLNIPDMYFVHSYMCKPNKDQDILLKTTYGEEFCSAVNKNKIYGFQFHPEKSGPAGYKLLDYSLGIC